MPARFPGEASRIDARLTNMPMVFAGARYLWD